MENHKELCLSDLRKYIIRYGAKYMETFESDLFYDCSQVGKMKVGDSLYWMVSKSHTYLYDSNEVKKLGSSLLAGDRFNYRIDCSVRFGQVEYAMTEITVWDLQRLEVKSNGLQ